MSENREIYTAGKNFTLPPAVTAWTNSTSAIKDCFALKHSGSFDDFVDDAKQKILGKKNIFFLFLPEGRGNTFKVDIPLKAMSVERLF